MAFNPPRWTLANILPVLLVVKIVVALWCLYTFLHLMPLINSKTPDEHQRGVWQAAFSQTVTVLMLLCFLRAMATDPGSVPKNGQWQRTRDAPAHEEDVTVWEKKHSGESRFCKFCNQHKPDRTHHCRVCRSCVLRMDHHCPWIANCVGFHNHKFFLLLVFYSLINCLFISATFSETMMWAINEETTPLRRFGVVYCMTLAATMCLLLIPFSLLHLSFLVQNQTTLEFCEKRSRKSGGPVNYNLGLLENMHACLGPYKLLWLLPVFPPEGNGVSFPRNDAAPSSSGGADASLLGGEAKEAKEAKESRATAPAPAVKVNVKVNVKKTVDSDDEPKKVEESASKVDEVDMAPEVTGGRGAEA